MKPTAKKYNRILKAILAISLGVVVVATVGAWYYIFYQSNLMSVSKTEANFAYKAYNVLSGLEVQMKKYAASNQIVSESLPKSKDVSTFIADVEQTAAGNGLKTTEITIGSKSVKGKTTSQEFSQTISKDGYYELPMTLTFKGSYNSVTKLLTDLNNYRRIVVVNGLNIKKDIAETSANSDNVVAEIQLSIFSRK